MHAWLSRAQSAIFRALRVTGAKSLSEISTESDSVVINSQPILDFAMPQSSQVIHIGGFAVDHRPPSLSSVSR